MEIISRAQWGAVPPTATSPFQTISGWVVHYVGADLPIAPTLDQSCATMRALQRDAMTPRRGYDDFEYNFAVDPVGRIFEGRGWLIKSGANGTTASNSHEWAVVYLGGPDTPLTAAAQQALLWLTQTGAQRSGAVSTVRPHSAVFNTACPGDHVRAFIPTLQQHLHDATPAPTPSPNFPNVTVEDDMVFPAPAAQQTNVTRPAYAWLDKANKRIWFENHAKIKEPVLTGANGQSVAGIPASTPIIGAYASADAVVVVCVPDATGSASFAYHWA